MSDRTTSTLKAAGAVVGLLAATAAPFIALGQYRAEAAQQKKDIADLQSRTDTLSRESAANRLLLERIDERTLEIQRQLNRRQP